MYCCKLHGLTRGCQKCNHVQHASVAQPGQSDRISKREAVVRIHSGASGLHTKTCEGTQPLLHLLRE